MASPLSSDALSGLVTISTEPDIRIFYTLSAPISSSKPIIVVSNSLAAATPLWDDFTAHFVTTHNILRYDARFHGRSPLSTSPDFDYDKGHSIEDLASDVAKLLDALDVKQPVTFVGLSIGGGVGVVLAAQYPDKFDKLIIVGTKAAAVAGDDEAFTSRVEFFRQHGSRATAAQSVQRWFGDSWIAAHPETATTVQDIVAGQSLEGYKASVAALITLDLSPHVEEVRKRGHGQKLLFVVGEWDAEPVVHDTKTLAERTGSQVVVVKEAGHIVNVQQPERFHEVVRSKLDERL
ncbi:Alpha/Beta hydrolase protein [Paraphoma chrysanthemicola]|uniref:Alpha/Beta hydrolase protein n=1 Tax=Paraphoma chrysanthemicola TaxID=798071 RepID=A0A8K0R5P4_9PLEO|nr:Alpha/Beta hydrolase protein [Paraphoma chrysanthemicola]